MKAIVEKLRSLEQSISAEKGGFLLFALFLREESPDLWDLLVAAPWISENKSEGLRYLSNKLRGIFSPNDMLKFSRIVVIEPSDPALSAFHRSIHVEHGLTEITNSIFFGLQIKHAYLITSMRQPSIAVEKTQRIKIRTG